jgi:hypothetical protein
MVSLEQYTVIKSNVPASRSLALIFSSTGQSMSLYSYEECHGSVISQLEEIA